MTRSFVSMTAILLMLSATQSVIAEDESGWVDLVKDVNPSRATVAGEWSKSGNSLTTNAATASRIALPYSPKSEYDFRVTFTRNSGVHSIALMFVMGTGQATFEVDAWGEHLAGLQMIDGQSMQQNATRRENVTLENGRRYTATVEVRKDRVRALLDDKLIAEHRTDGSDLSMPGVWRMPDQQSLGLGAYQAATTFHSVQVRPVSGGATLAAANTPARPSRPPAPTPTSTTNRERRASATGKRVLIVIANQDFFYREYGDPREALERAGIEVEVAAGRKAVCRPHRNSGESGTGEVMPDLAIADVDPSRYDAIMFSGGWGSSMYQYAFNGSYNNRAYNGDRDVKAAVNRKLAEFIEQDKYVGALCHGVSVLAWARVNGRSILAGRRAVASPRQSPAGIYNGQRGQPLSRWNAEANGARLTPARSIGNPGTSEDDVLVDGKLITGEDDNSARLFGETLARLLTQ
ncbi:DJ-1/PfpI family protein [Calycomorphotria hydatis]|uniref:General stress protein 18 n=1 Tax=Calycomorphotria hydatis TaxID=2528027 RepID=A0A517T7F6_9PLAN|nr:DJ-1/PfpI family protein [Calycomorphotria hydatis]QDT64306.1 General stress protein 18 [Calycomorphotria hydatis]